MPEIPDQDTVPVLISPGGEAQKFSVVTYDRRLVEDEPAIYCYWANTMRMNNGVPVPGFGITIEHSDEIDEFHPEHWIISGYGIREKKA